MTLNDLKRGRNGWLLSVVLTSCSYSFTIIPSLSFQARTHCSCFSSKPSRETCQNFENPYIALNTVSPVCHVCSTCLYQGCEVRIFCGTPTTGFKKMGHRLRPQHLKISRLRLRVKVGNSLVNLCDCDTVLSERCRQTNSQHFKNNNNKGLLLL